MIKSVEEVEVFGANVIAEPIFEEMSDGVYKGVPDDNKADQGVIVAVGRGLSPSQTVFVVGDIVVFNKYAPDKIFINGKEYLVIHIEDIKGRKKHD